MSIRKKTLLCLLQRELSALNLDSTDADAARPIEKQVAKSFLKTLGSLDNEDFVELDTSEELYDSQYKSEEFDPVFEDCTAGRAHESFSYEYICKVLDFKEAHPRYSFASLQNQYKRLRDKSYLSRFREYRAHMGTNRERYRQIAKYCKESFDTARANGVIVHDRLIRMWALQKARELELTTFTASHGWIAKWKNIYRISSRKIVRFITYKHHRLQEEIEDEAASLIVEHMDQIHGRFDPTQIFNTDQSGFNYITRTNRTLSHIGERITEVSVNALGPLTHSYTIQPLLNMDGRLVGKLYVNLQEVNDEFGPRVAPTLQQFPNLYITCSRSGKLNRGLVREWSNNVFREVVERLHENECVLYVDAWGGHNDEDCIGWRTKMLL